MSDGDYQYATELEKLYNRANADNDRLKALLEQSEKKRKKLKRKLKRIKVIGYIVDE